MMPESASRWTDDSFLARPSLDLILAILQKENGIEVLHSRNVKDFKGLVYFRLMYLLVEGT